MSDAIAEASAEGIRIIRVFDAPREQVFRAWTEPERFAHWFGGAGADVPVSSVSLDARPGGEWKATMFAGPDRTEIPWRGTYREVVEPERLVLTITDRPGDEYELLTVLLTDLGDGRTRMEFTQTGGHLDAEGYGGARDGWTGFFDALEESL
jgi:uncharacterized protein YndB with AHSA1/START domain